MELLKRPIIMAWLVISFITMVLSVLLSIFMPGNTFILIVAVLLSQAASSIFFPILVGFFYDRIKEEESGSAIWKVFKEFSDGGIVRIYKDREDNPNTENAVMELRQAFLNHREGQVKLIGVSLRVFFNPAGSFYKAISEIASASKAPPAKGSKKSEIQLKALISHPESAEVINRGKFESSGKTEPLIKSEISLTAGSIKHLQSNFPDANIQYGYYREAPYCTLVVFPDKCYFSPNILSKTVPVRLPMIIFRSGSHGYNVLNAYFDELWQKRIVLETNQDE